MSDGQDRADGLVAEVEAFRRQLTAHCYRMLACPFAAEDAFQETALRVWRHADRFDPERSTLQTWTYAIATRVCLDHLRSARRRGRVTELSAPARPGSEVAMSSDRASFVWPVADSRVIADDDPATIVEQRSQVRLAFVALLQRLPARQRAALLLREVLGFTASEVATQLDATPAAVESALQRARATMSAMGEAAAEVPDRQEDLDLLERYCDTFSRGDVSALVSMLHDDIVMEMPPSTWWLRGRADVCAALSSSSNCRSDRALSAHLNGSIAFRQIRPDGATAAYVILETKSRLVSRITAYIGASHLDPVLSAPPMTPAVAERRNT